MVVQLTKALINVSTLPVLAIIECDFFRVIEHLGVKCSIFAL